MRVFRKIQYLASVSGNRAMFLKLDWVRENVDQSDLETTISIDLIVERIDDIKIQ